MKRLLPLLISLLLLPGILIAQTDSFADDFNAIQYALNRGDATESLKLLDSFCESYPDSSKAWFLRSQVERQIIQYKKALTSVSRAITLEPGVSAYYYLASSLYSDLQQHDLCVSYCDTILGLDSTHLFASILKAQALSKDGKIQEALDQYYSLHLRDTLNINFMKQIGSMHTKMDSLYHAIDWYSRAIDIDTADIPSYTHLGKLYVLTEQYETGLPVLTVAITIDSLNSWLYRFRGSLNIMGGNLEEAESDFTRAISLGDSTAFTFRHLGLSLYKQSKYEEAFPVYQTTVELDPEDSRAWYYLAFCYKWKEDLENALLCMEKSLQLSVTPGISDVYSGLAQFHSLKREYDTAMHYYDRAYEWNRENAVPLAQMGMLVEQTGGRKEDALAYYESYLEKTDRRDISLLNYIENRVRLINEKLFMEGKLKPQK